MVAGQEGRGVVAIAPNTEHLRLQTLRQALQAFVADGNDYRGPRALKQGTEHAFQRGFVAIIIGMIPVEVHGDRHVGRKGANRAIAFVDLGDHPRRSGGSPCWREIWVAKKPAQYITKIRAGGSQRRDQHPAGRGLTMATAHGDESTTRNALRE